MVKDKRKGIAHSEDLEEERQSESGSWDLMIMESSRGESSEKGKIIAFPVIF